MPAAIVSSIACRPSSVAGILMKRLGRSTSPCRRMASDFVLSVSCARSGSTSSETQPSLPLPSSETERRMSQASRMSSLASCQKISFGSSCSRAQLPDLLVIGVALGDRALEDRRIGGHAHDALIDQSLQVAILHEAPRQEVDPDALIVLGELLQGCHIGVLSGGGPHRVTLPTEGPVITRVKRGRRGAAASRAQRGRAEISRSQAATACSSRLASRRLAARAWEAVMVFDS